MKWVVYIVETSDGSYYTGITNDIDKRIKAHNNGTGAKYTKGRSPVKLLHYEECKSKSDALKLEYKIKQMSHDKKMEWVRLAWMDDDDEK